MFILQICSKVSQFPVDKVAETSQSPKIRHSWQYIGLKFTFLSCVFRGNFTFGSGRTFVLGFFCQIV